MDAIQKLIHLSQGNSQASSAALEDTKIYVSAENANRTIYLADLPRNTSYMDISEFYESKIGSCQIMIKR